MNAVHKRVWSGTIGSGVGATVSTLILWILGVTFWGAPSNAASAEDAITAVPSPIAAFVLLVVTVGLTFLGGWLPSTVTDVLADAGTVVPGEVVSDEPADPTPSPADTAALMAVTDTSTPVDQTEEPQ